MKAKGFQQVEAPADAELLVNVGYRAVGNQGYRGGPNIGIGIGAVRGRENHNTIRTNATVITPPAAKFQAPARTCATNPLHHGDSISEAIDFITRRCNAGEASTFSGPTAAVSSNSVTLAISCQ